MKKSAILLTILFLKSISFSGWWFSDSMKCKEKLKMEKCAVRKLIFVRSTDSIVDTSNIYYESGTERTQFPDYIFFDSIGNGGIYNKSKNRIIFLSTGSIGPNADSGAYIQIAGKDTTGNLIMDCAETGEIIFRDNLVIDNEPAQLLTTTGITGSKLILYPKGMADGGDFFLSGNTGSGADSSDGIIEVYDIEIRGNGGIDIDYDTATLDGNVGVNGLIDVHYSGVGLILGADDGDVVTRTDNTIKDFHSATIHYDTDEENVCLIRCYNSSTENILSIGGNDASLNGATSITLHTNTGNSTLDGVKQFEIQSDGGIFMYNLATSTGTDIISDGSNEICLKSSSKRFKKNIKISKLNSQILQKFKIYDFKWKENSKDDFGFIAEELTTLFPEIVTYHNGEIQSWDTQKMVVLLVAETQRLNRKTELLRLNLFIIYSVLALIIIYIIYLKINIEKNKRYYG